MKRQTTPSDSGPSADSQEGAIVGYEGAEIGEELQSGEYVQNDDNNAIRFDVEDTGDPTAIQFVLRAVDGITWWKHLEVYTNNRGVWTFSRQLETKDTRRNVSVSLPQNETTTTLQLQFWKGGLLGMARYVTSSQIDGTGNLGKRLIFTYERD
jgi:hypothetical protein